VLGGGVKWWGILAIGILCSGSVAVEW
jgi:hypothetical protein